MKFMNLKRFASTVMAGVLTLSLAVPAFAADDNTTVIQGGYDEIPIAVEVPATGTAQINPYGLPVELTLSSGSTVSLTGQKITTQPLNVKNQGSVKLDMDASLLVIPKGDVAIAAAKGTDKTIKVDLEVAAVNDDELAVLSDNERLPDLLIQKFADDANWENATTLAAPAVAKAATTGTASKSTDNGNTSPLAILGAATVNAGAGTTTYGADSIAFFRLTGDLAEEPVDASSNETPWAAADGFTATIVFKFTPHIFVDASISLDQTALTLAAQNDTADIVATFNPGDTELTVKSWAWTSADGTKAQVSGTTATGTVLNKNSGGPIDVTCTVTLSDDTTRTATCAVTCS